MPRQRVRMRRAEAVPDGDGKRHCAACGDFIDPIDWCGWCKTATRDLRLATGDPTAEAACSTHQRPRKRADAAFCNGVCRSWHRSTFMSAIR